MKKIAYICQRETPCPIPIIYIERATKAFGTARPQTFEPTTDQNFKTMRNILVLFFFLTALAMQAQTSKTTETQRDRYGHITGTAVTTTKSDGTQETVYKDRYGHITGRSTTKQYSNGRTETTYKDSYGHVTGTSTTRTTGKRSETTYKDRYGHITGSSVTKPDGKRTTTTYKDRYGHIMGTSTTKKE